MGLLGFIVWLVGPIICFGLGYWIGWHDSKPRQVEVRMTSGYDDGIVGSTRPALPVRHQHRFVTEWMDE